mmetsp:Transcript_4488/g.7871  ORF Transcript_4488/g.7871 Transcript_4488/m.7871 type:complete len:159 (-) Transcript_4488:454-930(-)
MGETEDVKEGDGSGAEVVIDVDNESTYVTPKRVKVDDSLVNSNALCKDFESGSEHPKDVITGLCRLFYSLRWATGTGGGISIRENGRIYLAPSGVQKERMHPNDVFVLDESNGSVIESPVDSKLKISACRPLFMLVSCHFYRFVFLCGIVRDSNSFCD